MSKTKECIEDWELQLQPILPLGLDVPMVSLLPEEAFTKIPLKWALESFLNGQCVQKPGTLHASTLQEQKVRYREPLRFLPMCLFVCSLYCVLHNKQ